MRLEFRRQFGGPHDSDAAGSSTTTLLSFDLTGQQGRPTKARFYGESRKAVEACFVINLITDRTSWTRRNRLLSRGVAKRSLASQ